MICIVMISAIPTFAVGNCDVTAMATQGITQDRAQDLYDAYMAVFNASDLSELESATEQLKTDVTVADSFTEQEKQDLQSLFGKPAEEIVSEINFVCSRADKVLYLDDLCISFVNEKNIDTAKAIAKEYESIFEDEEYIDKNLREMARQYIGGLDEVYRSALTFIDIYEPCGDETAAPQNPQESTKDETTVVTNPTPVKTGKSRGALVCFAFVLVTFAVIVCTKRRLKTNT